ncbi:MAG: DUF6518 family protein [Streptosporangiales bacterium]
MRPATEHLTRVRQRSTVAVAIAAVVGGIVLGAIDLLAQTTLPYPWANLANSSAVWAIAAFAFATWVRYGPLRCVVAAAVLLVVAVQSYRLAAILTMDNDPAILVSPVNILWLAFGVVAGCVFGLAGHLRAVRGRWLAAVGAAFPVAVLLAEAALFAARGGTTGQRETALIEVLLAVVAAVLAGRGLFGKVMALAIAVPLAAVGRVAFGLAGFST